VHRVHADVVPSQFAGHGAGDPDHADDHAGFQEHLRIELEAAEPGRLLEEVADSAGHVTANPLATLTPELRIR
jgi:hypothetical protein